ncbi:hypothetical protein V2S66_21020 [Streptomyces sp. V4-01]|uniref:HEAT repeat domain-containing protein n=1 Tax=Actinacidiphila polyblastidii TaxID=3110430 RepID=A0ABU7PF61_9ACTN|nr:hypothetical protein [Streptomyces sp. V4-01]
MGRGRPWRPAQAPRPAGPAGGGTGRAAPATGGLPGGAAPAAVLRGRIGWLLRVNRLYAADDRWTRAATFTAAFAGGSHPGAVSTSKVSRWENGLVAVERAAVRRYEEVLALESGSLLSTVDVITRYLTSAPSAAAAALPSAGPAARAAPPTAGERRRGEGLLERLDSTDTLTGRDWDEATAWIVSEPGLRLRRREWDAVCHRLLVETVAADGEAWKPRFEAYLRLLNHPGSRMSAIATCGDWAASPGSRVFIETLSMLDASTHPDAARHVVAQLRAPTNGDALTGALLATVRKLREHHFTAEQRDAVTDAVLDVLADPARRGDPAYPLAAAALRLLPPEVSGRLSARLRQGGAAPRGGPGGASRASAPGGLPRPDTDARSGGAGQGATGRLHPLITARSTAMLARELPQFQDLLLPVLVGELLDAPLSDDRLYAGFLIRATPYRGPVADTLVWELARQRPALAPARTVRLLEALRVVGTPAERPFVEALAARQGLPGAVQSAAVQALGHMGGASAAGRWQTLLARHTAAATAGAGSRAAEDVLHHAVYSLAIGRHTAVLGGLAATHPLASVRASARWWLDLPTHMYVSAAH